MLSILPNDLLGNILSLAFYKNYIPLCLVNTKLWNVLKKYPYKERTTSYEYMSHSINLTVLGFKFMSKNETIGFLPRVIKNGQLKTAVWLYKRIDATTINKLNKKCVLSWAIKSENIYTLQWAWSKYNFWHQDEIRSLCKLAAQLGNLTIFKWIVKQCRLNPDICHQVSLFRNYSLLKWIMKEGCPFDERVFSNVCRHGDLDMVQWLYENYCIFSQNSLNEAVLSGNLSLLQWLLDKGFQLESCAYNNACNGHPDSVIEILNWLKKHKCPVPSDFWLKVAFLNNEDIIDWTLANTPIPMNDAKIVSRVVQNGNVKLCEPLIQSNKLLLTTQMFEKAVKTGKFEMVKWLYQKQCPLPKSNLCSIAANINRYDLVDWLMRKGYEYDCETIKAMLLHGKLDFLKRIHKYSNILNLFKSEYEYILYGAAEQKQYHVIQWMYEQGCKLTPYLMKRAILDNNLQMVRWYTERNCPWDRWLMTEAICVGNLEILIYLYDHKCPFFSRNCSYAVTYDKTNILRWLHSNRLIHGKEIYKLARKIGGYQTQRWLNEIHFF